MINNTGFNSRKAFLDDEMTFYLMDQQQLYFRDHTLKRSFQQKGQKTQITNKTNSLIEALINMTLLFSICQP